MTTRRSCLLVLIALSVACASAPKSETTTPLTGQAARNPDVISTQELRVSAVAGGDAMNAVQLLRPAFLRTRGVQSMRNTTAGQTQISQDFGPLQPLDALKTIEARSLVEIRFLNNNDAQQRFGVNANGGPVIVVLTSKQ